MLAMHYAIALKGVDQVAAVRARAAERGPWFDGMVGLGVKLFLIDPVDPCYATFYLWREAEAALGFLEGTFFRALSETFGRPEVKLLLTTATDLPFRGGEALRLQVNPKEGLDLRVRAVDALGGDVLALAPESASGRRFEGDVSGGGGGAIKRAQGKGGLPVVQFNSRRAIVGLRRAQARGSRESTADGCGGHAAVATENAAAPVRRARLALTPER